MRKSSISRALVLTTLVLGTGCPPEKGAGTTDSDPTGTTSSGADTTSAATGATTTGDPTAGTTEAEEEPFCVNAGPGSASVQECALDFCPPDALHVEANNADGGDGLEYEGGYTGFQLYKYRTGDEVRLTLQFDAKPDAETTDAVLAENLLAVTMWIDHPFPDATPLGSMSTLFRSETSPWLLEAVVFEGGRFKLTAEIDVTEATQHVYSNSEACYTSDIGGQCRCEYAGFTIPTTIAIDLSLVHEA
ncbi:hypothetical protein [Nannocystis punicea]|uniref:Lipoprotein n=1 Tax=Nannocystis punicea TaxID=2995304 RepID=A0ABY7HJ50_9BACT|nr:hypothetical protein [Nannocystis poenicansa]WAS99373.1 hypothetical protein O0S08_24865 [Nannocystis poenicansa]